MAKFKKISEINDPRVSIYRSLKSKHLESQGIFIAEGPKVINSLLASGIKALSFLTTESFCKSFRSSAPVYVMPAEEIEKVIGFRFHRGIMAACRSPEKLQLEKTVRRLKKPHLLVAFNGVNDPENVGLIVRNAAAFGASAVIVDRKTYDPYYRRAVRVSMGTIFDIPVIYTDELRPGLKFLKDRFGTRIIVTSLGSRSIDAALCDMSGNICLVFGNEDKGVDRDVAKEADLEVRIPIERCVDSLNVACASAILLREAYLKRQNGKIQRKRV
jgi:tRNA G18 (ribose-2'-O)-methylase SpoU